MPAASSLGEHVHRLATATQILTQKPRSGATLVFDVELLDITNRKAPKAEL